MASTQAHRGDQHIRVNDDLERAKDPVKPTDQYPTSFSPSPSLSELRIYSPRSATSGSMRAARRAGA
jgi:hypothetical protein